MLDTKPVIVEEVITINDLARMISRLENRLIARMDGVEKCLEDKMDKGFAANDAAHAEFLIRFESIDKRFDENDATHAQFKKELNEVGTGLNTQISGLGVYYPTKQEHNLLKTRVTRIERKLQIS